MPEYICRWSVISLKNFELKFHDLFIFKMVQNSHPAVLVIFKNYILSVYMELKTGFISCIHLFNF